MEVVRTSISESLLGNVLDEGWRVGDTSNPGHVPHEDLQRLVVRSGEEPLEG